MQLAVAEKGLLVLDVIVKVPQAHAAHNNPDIYNAIPLLNGLTAIN
jgi:acetylornithine deacetylase